MSLIGFKLFIGNLSKETHDTGLEKYFKDAIGGEIVWAQVCKDRNTGESKRYGFITFKDEADGKRAIEELHETELDGSKITVDRSTQGMIEKDGGGRGAEDENVRLFVGGLPDNCVEEDLME
ncbi:rna recognition motif-containing protein [Nannochloropsis gaditana]|uniref:Rna recognition motif-containing protein n=1 Tax=Nannochloropsis gaditana TaxID=72520 RepID=W7TRC8_9STRA|nr:rna recognition motif-containing protein [Nannochloropsis gaditana]